MQNYDYFDILDFKDRSDRDPLFSGSRSYPKIAIRKKTDCDRELQHYDFLRQL